MLVVTSSHACPYTPLGVGGARESSVSPSGGGLCYIFFAGNRVMIDFKCYFIAIFKSEVFHLEFEERRRLKWVCTNFNCFYMYYILESKHKRQLAFDISIWNS